MKYWEAAIITVVIGYAGDAVPGKLLSWPNAGLVCAIAAMGAIILWELERKKNQ